jgi:exopolysaccharide biosynthesis protein
MNYFSKIQICRLFISFCIFLVAIVEVLPYIIKSASKITVCNSQVEKLVKFTQPLFCEFKSKQISISQKKKEKKSSILIKQKKE